MINHTCYLYTACSTLAQTCGQADFILSHWTFSVCSIPKDDVFRELRTTQTAENIPAQSSIYFIRISEEYQSSGLQTVLLSDTIFFTMIYAAAAIKT
jgi:hypothetical protein